MTLNRSCSLEQDPANGSGASVVNQAGSGNSAGRPPACSSPRDDPVSTTRMSALLVWLKPLGIAIAAAERPRQPMPGHGQRMPRRASGWRVFPRRTRSRHQSQQRPPR